MVGKNVFEKLVETLSAEERQEFIRRMNKAPYEVPLGQPNLDANEDPEMVWERHYRGMSFLQKFLLLIKALFSGKEIKTLVHEKLLADLAAQLERECPGMFHFRFRMIHATFYYELKNLFDGFKVFRKPFSHAFGPNKADFLAFLVGLQLEDVQARLLDEANPWKIYEKNNERTSKDIKSIAEGNFRLIMDTISPEKRKALYEGVKSLYILRQLVFLNEEKYFKPFNLVTVGGSPGSASLDDLRQPLTLLWEKLAHFLDPPPAQFLEGLFLFHFQDRLEDASSSLEGILGESMKKASDAMARIRHFNSRVPLSRLVAYLNGKLSYQVRPSGGVEDWFVLYRKFWQSKLDRDFREFSKERAEKLLMQEIYNFLEVTQEEFRKEPMYPPYYPGQLPTKGDKALLFLKHFMSRTFMPKINPLLKVILLEGDFYKKHNRGVFTDNYNFLLQIPDKLHFFQKNFLPEGEWGGQLAKVKNTDDEEAALVRIKEIFLLAGDWVENFLDQAFQVCSSFLEVVRGLNKGDSSGKFDTLSNIGQIGGRSNIAFRKELEALGRRWEKFHEIFHELKELG